jgi:Na+-translocating ferredoxin:NAD+ oxidoreductase RnfG subunit
MNSAFKMVFTLSIISALAAGALSAGNRLTRDKIKAEAKAAATRAVKRIFPKCLFAVLML